jgi:cytochrome b
MKTTSCLIWDLPTRFFHWLLAGGFTAAAAIAFLSDEKSGLFPWHAILGLVLGCMVLLRLAWGFIGSRHARFTSFLFGPRSLLDYLKGALQGGGERHIGHNPGSAYAIFAMLALMLGIAGTGLLLARGHKDFKEPHELMVYALLTVVAAHLAGVILHTLRHRENITLSMIHGRKDCDPSQAIDSTRPVSAILFLVLLGGWAFSLVGNYHSTSKTTQLPLLGSSLHLGENGDEGKKSHH